MTLAEVRALAKTLYYGMTGKSDVDDNQWNLVLDAINKTYFREAVRGLGSLFSIDSGDLSATAGVYDYSGSNLNAAGVYQIMDVATKFSGEYYPLEYAIPQDRYKFNSVMGTDPLIPTAYSLLGEKVVLLPISLGTSAIRITYVPNPNGGIPLSDSNPVLDNKMSAFHQLLAYDAAISFAPVERSVAIRNGLYTRLRQQWEEYLQSRHRQRGRMIRHVEHE